MTNTGLCWERDCAKVAVSAGFCEDHWHELPAGENPRRPVAEQLRINRRGSQRVRAALSDIATRKAATQEPPGTEPGEKRENTQ